MDVVKRAIADGKIAPLPKQGVKVSDEELRALHNKRIVYFEKRKGEVLDLLEGVMGVRSVDESKLSSSVYFNTPYGKVRLSDHAEPMGTGHAVSTVLDLRYDMSDAEVLAAAEGMKNAQGGTLSWSLTPIYQANIIADLRKDSSLNGFMDAVDKVELTKKREFGQEDVIFGELSDDDVEKLMAQNPGWTDKYNLKGAKHSIDEKHIWHTYRGHCLDYYLKDDGLNLTYDDIRMIPDILRNYDSITPEFKDGRWGVVYVKNYSGVEYRYSAYISKPHRRSGKPQNVHLVTGWITKKAVAGDGLTPQQPQATSASRFHRTAIVTPMEEYIKQNYAEEAKRIALHAKDKSLALLAPNGMITNLTPVQWLQVRTGAFKGWFGDWERAAELTFDGSEYNNETCLKMLTAEAGIPFVNEETGIEAEINNRQRGKITSGKAQRKSKESGFSTGVHNFVAAHIRRLFKHAVHVGDYRDKNQSDDVLTIKRFVCPVRVKETEAFAYMTVKELKQHGHKIYTLELDTIERLGGNLDEHFEEMLNPAPSKDILARLNELNKTYFEDSSKVVDENGEPLVVYHGTRSDFTVFDREKGGESNKYAYAGFWFSPIKGFGERFLLNTWWGDGVEKEMALFLNLRNPKVFETRKEEPYGDAYEQFRADVVSLLGKDAEFANIGGLGMAWHKGVNKMGIPDYMSTAEQKEVINEYRDKLKAEGYDGILIRQTEYDYSTAGSANDQYVAFEPNQIKSATDNRGTFDGSNADITYSVTGGKNLAAVHTLSAEKFLAAVELGGMPMPSVAVARLDRPYEWGGAGAINLIGKRRWWTRGRVRMCLALMRGRGLCHLWSVDRKILSRVLLRLMICMPWISSMVRKLTGCVCVFHGIMKGSVR